MKLSRLSGNPSIGQIRAELRYNAGHEAQRFEVFHDVAALVGDEEQVEIFEGLVAGRSIRRWRCRDGDGEHLHVSHLIGFNKCVLLAAAQQLGERGEQPLDPNSRNFDELAGEKKLAGLRAQRN
jgi:hypothetical protein